MLLLGLLLMAVSGAFVGLLIADNLSGGPEYQVTVLGNDLVRMNSLGVFLAGVALALIFCLGLALLWPSRRRTARPVGVARRRADYREAEPVEPARRSAPAERAAPGYDAPAHAAPAHDASVRDASAYDDRVSDDRVSDAPGSTEPGSDEVLAPPEERAAEEGGQEEQARTGGRARHLFGR